MNRNKFDLIQDFLPPIILSRFNDKGWSSFYFLQNLYTSLQGNRRLLPLSDDLAKKVSFDAGNGGRLYLKNFLSNLDEIIGSTDRYLIKEKVIEVKNYYFDRKASLKQLAEDEDRIKRDLLLIYRFRNKIVHDAHFDRLPLSIWADRLETYVRFFLGSILDNHCKSHEKIHDFLNRTKVEYLVKVKSLENASVENIFNLSFNPLESKKD